MRMIPRCAGPDCTREVEGGWLVLLGTHGQPCYFFCPDCEQTRAEWIDRQLGEDGRAAGCTGMVRLESGSPAEVFGMIRG